MLRPQLQYSAGESGDFLSLPAGGAEFTPSSCLQSGITEDDLYLKTEDGVTVKNIKAGFISYEINTLHSPKFSGNSISSVIYLCNT